MSTIETHLVYDKLKDSLRLILSSLILVDTNCISFETNKIIISVTGYVSGSYTIDIKRKNNDSLLSFTCHYKLPTSFKIRTGFSINSESKELGFINYMIDDLDEILLRERNSLNQTINTCKLQYPLQEEQVFQELTRFPVPLESDIDFFMDTGKYIMEDITDYLGFTLFMFSTVLDVLDDLDCTVQHIDEAVRGLIEHEKSKR